MSAVQIRPATVADAARISALIRSLSTPFFASPDGEGTAPFLDSIGEPAIRSYVSAPNFRYLVAESARQLAGVAAMRDGCHLYHLFVAPAFQGQGLARVLWQRIRTGAASAGNEGRFTVNSSLAAVEVYRRFGFVPDGPAVVKHGVAFQPMRLAGNEDAASRHADGG
jgi:GNAT superfamily N-acetyltransferase